MQKVSLRRALALGLSTVVIAGVAAGCGDSHGRTASVTAAAGASPAPLVAAPALEEIDEVADADPTAGPDAVWGDEDPGTAAPDAAGDVTGEGTLSVATLADGRREVSILRDDGAVLQVIDPTLTASATDGQRVRFAADLVAAAPGGLQAPPPARAAVEDEGEEQDDDAAPVALAVRAASAAAAAPVIVRRVELGAAPLAGGTVAPDLGAATAPRSAPAAPQGTPWVLRSRLDAAAYQALVGELKAKGFRPDVVRVHGRRTSPRFAAIFVKDGRGWRARHGLTSDQYQAEATSAAAAGLRVASVSAWGVYPNERYAAVFVRDGRPSRARHRMTPAGYQEEFEAQRKDGFRPVWIDAIGSGLLKRFAAVWVKDGEAYASVHERTRDEMSTALDDLNAQGFRPVSITRYGTLVAPRYAAVFVRDGRRHLSFHELPRVEHQALVDQLPRDGFRPLDVLEVGPSNDREYTTLWAEDDLPDVFRARGLAVPALAGIDQAVADHMQKVGATRGAVAVTYRGRLVYNRSFTLGPVTADATPLDARFRLASVSKPITAVGVLRAVEQGLDLDRTLGSLLPQTALALDPRFRQVTVRQLLQHTGGWDRSVSGDPLYRDRTIARTLLVPLPLERQHYLTFMLPRKLDAAPGTAYAYSNFGYYLLGHVIERFSGRSYVDFMRDEVFARAGMTRTARGRTAQHLRLPGEVLHLAKGDDVRPDVRGSEWPVPAAYGGFNVDHRTPNGGWVSTAEDMARFLVALDDRDRSPLLQRAQLDAMFTGSAANKGYGLGWGLGTTRRNHNGAYAGTATQIEQRDDGVDFVLLFNRDGSLGTLTKQVRAAVTSVGAWPRHDLFAH